LNKQLQSLYKSKWQLLSKEIEKIKLNTSLIIKPANPLLLTVNQDYQGSDIKVMVIGQETNGWFEQFSNIDEITKVYNEFFWGGRCYKRGGQFWNGIKNFKIRLQQKYPDKRINIIWNNVIKIGKAKGKNKPPEYIQKIEREYFKVLELELEILKPDIILFLSGPNYDDIIKQHFPKIIQEAMLSIKQRQLCKFSIKGNSNCFRTYHPNYLYRSRKLDYFFEIIISEIKLNL